MKIKYFILLLVLLNSCKQATEVKQDGTPSHSQISHCDYIKNYQHLGNRIMDTITLEKRLVDPIDDIFKETDFGFVERGGKLYKKAKTHSNCNKKHIDVEFYQDFTNRIELASYREYNDMFFTTKGRVNFWWLNSGGHLIVPINGADPETFKPFENVCGGTAANGVFYGCPTHGVYKLNIPVNSNFKFIAKEKNYWNSPKHYIIIDEKVYDVKYELDKGYYCEIDESMMVEELMKVKKN